MKRKFNIAVAAFILSVLLLFAGCVPIDSGSGDGGSNDTPPVTHTVNINVVESPNYSSLADTVEAVHASVVEIAAGSSSGSGVFFAEHDGYSYLFTCHHVIEGAQLTSIKVKCTDGTPFTAELVGGHYDSDIAVLRVKATEGIVYAAPRSYTEENSLRVGEEVFVIGNPLGTLGGTVTSGIVSALKREVNVDGLIMTLIQTDAAINKGNSGGALFDYKGALVGIVNAKSIGTGVEGLGFAIPIEDALDIAQNFLATMNGGKYNGLGYYPGYYLTGVTADNATAGSPLTACARITSIHTDGIFYGKLEIGEYVSFASIGGKQTKISSASEFLNYFSGRKIGDAVTLTVIRNAGSASKPVYKTREETVTVAQYVYGYKA